MPPKLRPYVVALVALLPLVLAGFLGRVDLPASYHEFADQRALLHVNHGANVLSNLAFLAVGLAGLLRLAQAPPQVGRGAFRVFFLGVATVALGSGYYHLAPNDSTLLWDRLPMTLAFVGVLIGCLAVIVEARLERWLGPALVLGLGSVLHWRLTGDLRVYAWVQLAPLLVVPVVLVLYRERAEAARLARPLGLALVLYLLAKVAEVGDGPLFELTGGLMSGHTLKHLLAAASTASLLTLYPRRASTLRVGREKIPHPA